MRFVLDNSVSMRWLFADGSEADRSYAERILDYFDYPGCEALVPAIWSLEVANVIVKAEQKGLLTEGRSAEFVAILQQLGIRADGGTAPHGMHDTLQLARRFRLSSYDAAYLELALREGAPLATLDHALRAAVAATHAGLA